MRTGSFSSPPQSILWSTNHSLTTLSLSSRLVSLHLFFEYFLARPYKSRSFSSLSTSLMHQRWLGFISSKNQPGAQSSGSDVSCEELPLIFFDGAVFLGCPLQESFNKTQSSPGIFLRLSSLRLRLFQEYTNPVQKIARFTAPSHHWHKHSPLFSSQLTRPSQQSAPDLDFRLLVASFYPDTDWYISSSPLF